MAVEVLLSEYLVVMQVLQHMKPICEKTPSQTRSVQDAGALKTRKAAILIRKRCDLIPRFPGDLMFLQSLKQNLQIYTAI